jgi:hypothetical protein
VDLKGLIIEFVNKNLIIAVFIAIKSKDINGL